MFWYIFLSLAVALGIWFVWSLSKRNEQNKYLEEIARGMTEEELRRDFSQLRLVVQLQMTDPMGSGVSRNEADEALQRCVAYRNRLNELQGKEHGPDFRLKYRFELLQEIKKSAGI